MAPIFSQPTLFFRSFDERAPKGTNTVLTTDLYTQNGQCKTLPHGPLCVDLDGTLVLHDTLYHAVQQQSWRWWMHHGMCYGYRRWGQRWSWPRYKCWLTRALDPGWSWPASRATAVTAIMQLYPRHSLYLATGACHSMARLAARHWPVFSGIFATNPSTLLVGVAKARTLVHHFGAHQFHYMGDSWQDMAVWDVCHTPISVHGPHTPLGQALACKHPHALFLP